MLKKLALASALAVATSGLAATADAGYKHYGYGYKHFGYHHHVFKHYYKPVYTHHYYKPVYRYYKPVCAHYGWAYKHGHKVWTCLW